MEKERFQKVTDKLQEELSAMRTNRANPAAVEGVTVQAYQTSMNILELASVTAPEPQMLVIQPWDKSVLKAIETALRDQTEMNPVVDGDMIRIAFPPLTEETRKELVKNMYQKVEDARIAVRKVREDVLKQLKQEEKDGNMSEDDYFRMEEDVQKTVDSFNQTIKEMGEKKEADLMKV